MSLLILALKGIPTLILIRTLMLTRRLADVQNALSVRELRLLPLLAPLEATGGPLGAPFYRL